MALAFYLSHAQATDLVRFRIIDGDDGGLVIVCHDDGSKTTMDVPEARQHWLALRRQGWQQVEGLSPKTQGNLEALCDRHGI